MVHKDLVLLRHHNRSICMCAHVWDPTLEVDSLDDLMLLAHLVAFGGSARLSLWLGQDHVVLEYCEVILVWMHAVALIVRGKSESFLLGNFPVYAGMCITVVMMSLGRAGAFLDMEAPTVLHALGNLRVHAVVFMFTLTAICCVSSRSLRNVMAKVCEGTANDLSMQASVVGKNVASVATM